MKFKNPNCPKCGKLADEMLFEVVVAGNIEFDANGEALLPDTGSGSFDWCEANPACNSDEEHDLYCSDCLEWWVAESDSEPSRLVSVVDRAARDCDHPA